MNNRRSSLAQGIALALCTLVTSGWAPAVQADKPSPGLQCVIDTEVLPEGSSWEDLDHSQDFWKAKEIKCLGWLVEYSRRNFSQVPEPSRSIINRTAHLIREASLSHPAFAEYREECARENEFGETVVLVMEYDNGVPINLVPALASVDESCQGRY